MRLYLSLLVLLCSALTACAGERRPNVIVILADDLGWGDVGFNGRTTYKTPNLDRLARQGMRFTRWYTAAVVCAPSRAALLTGKYTIHNGVSLNNDELPRDEATVAAALKGVGYRTALFGKWHHGRPRAGEKSYVHPLDRGFDEFFGYTDAVHAWEKYPKQLWDGREKKEVKGYADTLFTDHAVDFIQRNKGSPFFLYLAFVAPHFHVEAPAEDVALYQGKFPEKDAKNPVNARYAAMITRLDKEVGRLLKVLDDLGLADDTLVIFSSDHGATFEVGNRGASAYHDSNRPFRGQKRTLWEGGIRVPGLVRWPGRIPAGKTSDVPVHMCDVFPTVMAAAGRKLDPQWKVDGRNLLPVWQGKEQAPRRTLFWEWRAEGYYQLAAMRGPIKFVITGEKGRPEMFNVVTDPGERRNIIAEHPELARELQQELRAWLKTQRPSAPKKETRMLPHSLRLAVAVTALEALILGGSTAAEPSAAAGKPANPIVPPDARLEKVFDRGLVLTEGVAVASDGMVYFSDITFSHVSKEKNGVLEAGHIWKFDPRTGKATIFRSPSGMSNGIKFDADGNMIVAEGADFGGRRVTRTDMKTGKSYILAALFEGRPLNSPNDIAIDEQGRIYFSDPRYLGHEPVEQPVQAVYRIDRDGSIHRIITDAGKPNGVCISPDQKTLYVVSNDNGTTGIGRLPPKAPVAKGRMALLAYDLAADGTAKFRKTLVDYAPQDGPDGLTCDVEGNLYVAVRDETRPGIYVYSPAGKELAYIKTELPTNVGFGRGPESRTLYITAGRSLYRIRLNREGYQLPPAPRERGKGASGRDKAPTARQDSAAGWKKLFDGKSLAGWKATDFYKPGKVHVRDGAVVMEKGNRMTGVTYAGKDFPKMDYEVTLEGKKLAGDDFFCTTTFPVGDSFCSLVVGGWGGSVVGLSSINGADASENETNREKEFKPGQWYRIRIRVTAKRIEAWIGAEKLVDLDTDGVKIATRIECLPSQPFGVATWDTSGAVRDIRVRLLSAAEKRAIAAQGAGKKD